MLLPVDLMSIVSAGSSSANTRGTGSSDMATSSSWLLAADAETSSESGNDIINKIFMSYASDGEADPAARFAADLKALLSANGVSLDPDQTLLPQTAELTYGHQSGEPGDLTWSVDELLQMSMDAVTGGNKLPQSDQTLPAVLSNWLAALTAPLADVAATTGAAAVSASNAAAAAVLSGASGNIGGKPARGLASVLTNVAASDALAGSVGAALPSTSAESGAGAEAESDILLSPATGRTPDNGGVGATHELALRAPLAADVARQTAESTQLNPGSHKVASEAANASAFRSIQFNPSGSGELTNAGDGVSTTQPDLSKANTSLERNQMLASPLTGSLVSGINTDNTGAASASQLFSQADGSTVMNRAEQRMFATESAQQAQSQATQQSVTRTADGLPRFVMDTAFGQQGWSDSLSRQLLVMSSQGVSSAQIQLDPPELGSLMVKIQVSADQQTSVSFVSQHALVRDALEQQLNRLQDLFRDQGLNLQDVSVSDQSPQQREDETGRQQGQDGGKDPGSAEQDTASADPVIVRSESLIDFYA